MQSYNPLDSVIFGLDVLVDIEPSRAYAAWADAIGGDISEVEDQIEESGVIEAFECGEIDGEGFIETVRDRLDPSLDDDTILEGWYEAIGEPLDGMVELIERLSVSLRVSVIANSNPFHLDALHETGEDLFSHIEHVFTSFEIGARTSDTELFEFVLDTLEVDPDDVAYFDSSATALLTATSLGIRSFESGDAEAMGSDLDPLIDSIPDSS